MAGEERVFEPALAEHGKTDRALQTVDRRPLVVCRRIQELYNQQHQRKGDEHQFRKSRQEILKLHLGRHRRLHMPGRKTVTGYEENPHGAEQEETDDDHPARAGRHCAVCAAEGERARIEAERDPAFRKQPRRTHVSPSVPCPPVSGRPYAEAAKRASFMRSARRLSAMRKASSSAWLAFSQGSQCVW